MSISRQVGTRHVIGRVVYGAVSDEKMDVFSRLSRVINLAKLAIISSNCLAPRIGVSDFKQTRRLIDCDSSTYYSVFLRRYRVV
jgi:hypothetical protein